MVCKNTCIVILLILCTQSMCYSPYSYRPPLLQTMRSSTSLKAGLCIRAGILIGLGIYKCWSWVSTKWRLHYDREIVEQSQRLCRQTVEQYDAVLRLLEPPLQANIENIDDPLIQQVSQIVCPANYVGSCDAIISGYTNQLGEKIALLDLYDNRIEGRLAQSQIRAELGDMRNQLQTISGRLRLLHGYFLRARPLITVQSLWIRHEDEIAGLQLASNYEAQWNVIRPAVMRYQLRHHDVQPYIRFVNDLENSLNAVQAVSIQLGQGATQVYQSLRTILNRILGSNEYQDDQRARQQAIQREAELAVQRAQAAAAAEQAKAAHARAAAEQTKARAALENAYEARRLGRTARGGGDRQDFVHDRINPL